MLIKYRILLEKKIIGKGINNSKNQFLLIFCFLYYLVLKRKCFNILKLKKWSDNKNAKVINNLIGCCKYKYGCFMKIIWQIKF